MSRFPGVKRILHFALGRRGLEREIDEEIAFHLESTIAELEAGGMSATEARAEAERRFGNLPEYRTALTRLGEQRRDGEQRREYLDILQQHLTYAWRGIVKRPGFALTIALTLALGIGANAVMFGVIDRLLFRAPEQITEPDRVRRLFVERNRPGQPAADPSISYLDGIDLLRAHGTEGVAMYTRHRLTYGEGVSARTIPIGLVSPEFFPLLGTIPALGRFFDPADDSTAIDNIPVVLGQAFWRREFNRDPGVIGRIVRLENHRFVVIGVAPEGFTGPELEAADLWFPLRPLADFIHAGDFWRTVRTYAWVHLVVRLAPGATATAIEAELLALHQAEPTNQAGDNQWRGAILGSLIAARSPDRGSEVPVSFWLAATSIFLLLIACANVATLQLARAVQRRREFAVRLALGVNRARLIAQLLTESLVLAVFGGTAAIALTWWGTLAIRGFFLPQLSWPASALDARTIVFIIGVTLITGILAGLIPAWLESRPDLLQSLKSGGAGGGSRRSRIQSSLVLAQAAMSVSLLIGAGLFVRSLTQLRALDLGLDVNHVLLAFPDFPRGTSTTRAMELTEMGLSRISKLPVVEQGALSTGIPTAVLATSRVYLPSGDTVSFPAGSGPYQNDVSPQYFATMGTYLVRGRLFVTTDDRQSAPVTVVSQAFANLVWPGADPLGKCFHRWSDTTPCLSVVGVVADAHWTGFFESPSYAFYTPLAQLSEPWYLALSIRPRGDPQAAIATIRAELIAAMPGVQSVDVSPMRDRFDPSLRSWRLGATLFLVFGALALVVAAVGLYSVMACRVAQRKHELGVRTALGATWQDLIQMVVREGVGLVSGGILIGLLIALAAAPAVAPLLYHTSPRDPEVMLVVTGVLLLAAAIACAIPAWRASRVDPMEALKAD
ncbi:MAG: ADOP family duplicated permease [Gemmatimonadota bacterium]